VISREPLSAQAQPPRRPSGADKKQQPAKKEGRQGRSRNHGATDGVRRSTLNSNHFAANQHCQTLEVAESSAKTIDGSLPERRTGVVLDEKCGQPQCQKMVRRGDLIGRSILLSSPAKAGDPVFQRPVLEPRGRSVLDTPLSRRFRGVRRPMMKLHFTFFAAFFTAAFFLFPSASSASRTCLNSLRSALSTLGKCRSSRSSALTMVEPITTRANHL
jgi:hypothetical protein